MALPYVYVLWLSVRYEKLSAHVDKGYSTINNSMRNHWLSCSPNFCSAQNLKLMNSKKKSARMMLLIVFFFKQLLCLTLQTLTPAFHGLNKLQGP
jgi:hypothetical protein